MTDSVRDNPARNRFELRTEAGLALANYRRDDRTITITHTEVPRAVEGRGIGSRLVKGMLDQIRQEAARWYRCVRSLRPMSAGIRNTVTCCSDPAA